MHVEAFVAAAAAALLQQFALQLTSVITLSSRDSCWLESQRPGRKERGLVQTQSDAVAVYAGLCSGVRGRVGSSSIAA